MESQVSHGEVFGVIGDLRNLVVERHGSATMVSGVLRPSQTINWTICV
jgi:hypothetical protein